MVDSHYNLSYDVLPFAIAELKKAGYKMVTLAECLGKPPYQNVTTPGTPDVSTAVASPSSLPLTMPVSRRGPARQLLDPR